MTPVADHSTALRVRTTRSLALDGEPTVVVVDSAVSVPAHGAARVVLISQERPTPSSVEEVCTVVRNHEASRMVGLGGGTALDVAKFAWRSIGGATSLELLPCGREPWRAFVPFSVVLLGQGAQRTVVDPSFGKATVNLVDEYLDHVPADVWALTALDTVVHAVESLLSKRSASLSRTRAMEAALGALQWFAPAHHPAPRPRDMIVAAALAAEALTMTGLGLAHAISTNLGARLNRYHDRFNVITGRHVITEWIDHPVLDQLNRSVRDRHGGDLQQVFDQSLDQAGVPPSLAMEGVEWADVEATFPLAAKSSGIKSLPRPLQPGDLHAFGRAVWDGASTRLGGSV